MDMPLAGSIIASGRTSGPPVGRPEALAAADAAPVLDGIFDLTYPRTSLAEGARNLDDASRHELFQMMARLLQEGIVGIETLDVRDEPYTSFITNRIAPSPAQHARPYRGHPATSSRLDVRA